jgi:hypothetical protein
MYQNHAIIENRNQAQKSSCRPTRMDRLEGMPSKRKRHWEVRVLSVRARSDGLTRPFFQAGVFQSLLRPLAGSVSFAQAGSPGKVTLSYSLNRLTWNATNQLAVWIEDAAGRHMQTLFATDFMARKKGFLKRPQCCPEWVKASGLAGMTDAQIDAFSGATQKPGRITLSWDCTDSQGKPVPPGIHTYKVEGNIAWEKRVLWTGRVTVGKTPDTSTASEEWLPEEARDAGVLVTEVSARFEPAGR